MHGRTLARLVVCALATGVGVACAGTVHAATPQQLPWARQWEGSIDRYLAKKEGPVHSAAVMDRYLGVLDWQGDTAGPAAGRYHAYLIHFNSNRGGRPQSATRAILTDGAGNIVGDVSYPNGRLAVPALRQADVFGIPQVKPHAW